MFVELAGEDLRRRLFLTSAPDGTELALRPDYTIPVCLHHLATGAAKRKAGYAYLGPVFRQRRDEPGEFLQAGVESLGRTDRVAADADVLKLALDAVTLLGVRKPTVRIGDSALFAAVLDALDLSPPWRRRLARNFGDRARLDGADRARRTASAPVHGRRPDARTRAAARRRAAELLAATGLGTIGGRTADEIADRFVEKAVLAAGIGDARRQRCSALPRHRRARPAKALDGAARARAERESSTSARRIDRFAARTEAFADHGIDRRARSPSPPISAGGSTTTPASSSRFTTRTRPAIGQIVGGGRYDRLMALIGARPQARCRPSASPSGSTGSGGRHERRR